MYEERPNDPLFVEAKPTPLTEAEAAYYLREAYKQVIGEYPSLDSLALLWGHTALEVGRWQKIYNDNWGNVKRLTGKPYTSYQCSEILNGKNQWFFPYHPQTFFAAWDNHLEGALAYLEFLYKRSRYAKAWEQVIKGNPAEYCHQLKVAGYYTANEKKYTKSVVSITNEFKKKAEKLLEWRPSLEVGERPSQLPTLVPVGEDQDIQVEYHIISKTLEPVKNPTWLVFLNKILDILKDLW